MSRGSESRTAGQHPLVQAYLASSEPTAALARKTPEPRDPVVQAMVLLDDCQHGQRPYEEAAEAVQKIDLGACDPSLHIILLEMWSTVANEKQRYGEVHALVKRARALVSKHIPAEIRALVRIMEAYRVIVGGDLARRAAGLKEALDLIPAASPRRPIMLLNYIWSFATQGRLAEVEPELAEVRAHSEFSTLSRTIELVNLVEIGQVDGALTIIAELGPPWQPQWTSGRMARQRPAYRTVRTIAAMMKGDSSLERAYRELGLGDPQDPDFAGPEVAPEKLPPFVLVLHHLLEHRPGQALQHARVHATEWGEAMVRETGLVSLNLLRSELACGHGEAARRLLDRRREIGNIHYLDGVFLARLALLAGDRGAAARHFAAALAAADRYGAHGRMDFELRTSCELSPGDIAWLGRAAGALQPGKSGGAGGPGLPASAAAVGGPRLVGESSALAQVRAAVDQLAPLDVPVLIVGETGTGKELVARLLHEQSPRRERPFVAINCGAIAETLLESELFGHEKGAFTGAAQRHGGIFEEAADGSVFLDEIGEISPRLQVMLLRVLETGEVRPVGSSRSRKIACRVIAATNAELQKLVEARSFRKDLYYRLCRMEIRIPSVRERREDVVPLIEHFLAEGRSDGRRPAVSTRLRQWLLAREWPGNVREIRNFVERLRLLNSEKLEYDLADIPAGAGAETGEIPSQPPAAVDAPAPPAAVDVPASSGAKPAATAERDEASFLAQGRSPLRRRDRLRALFARHGKLTRQELSTLLGVSLDTAGRDLKLLCAEGFVEKIEPTPSPRTHYFRLGRS